MHDTAQAAWRRLELCCEGISWGTVAHGAAALMPCLGARRVLGSYSRFCSARERARLKTQSLLAEEHWCGVCGLRPFTSVIHC